MAVFDTRNFKYGQWDVTLELIDVYDDEDQDVFVRIDCTGNWRATQGSIWESDLQPRYNEPELLTRKLKDIIKAKSVRMIHKYRRQHPITAC